MIEVMRNHEDVLRLAYTPCTGCLVNHHGVHMSSCHTSRHQTLLCAAANLTNVERMCMRPNAFLCNRVPRHLFTDDEVIGFYAGTLNEL